MRQDIFYKIQDFSFKNIDRFSTSSLVTRLTTDLTNIQMAYMMTIPSAGPRSYYDCPVSYHDSDNQPEDRSHSSDNHTVPGRSADLHCKKAHPHFIKVFDEYDILNNTVQENVNAARVVKAYVRGDYEKEKFHKISVLSTICLPKLKKSFPGTTRL